MDSSPFDPIESTTAFDTPLMGEPPVVKPSTRTGRLVALGEAAPVSDYVNQLNELTAFYNDQIKAGGEQQIRERIVRENQTAQIEQLAKLPKDDPSVSMDTVVAATRAVINQDVQAQAKYALERRALDRIQDRATAGDHVQAELLYNNFQFSGPDDYQADIDTKRLILRNQLEKFQIAKEDQGWMSDLVNFVVGSLPINYQFSRSGLVDTAEVVKKWGDGFVPGRRQNSESSSLLNLPLDQFSTAVEEHLIPNIIENATLFGYFNKGEALELMSGVVSAPSAALTNLISLTDTVGLATSLPLKGVGGAAMSLARAGETRAAGAAMRTAAEGLVDNIGGVVSVQPVSRASDVTSLLVRNGDRRGASRVVADAAQVTATEGAEAAEVRTGLGVSEVIDNMLPSAVNPGAPASGVPLSTAVTTDISRAEALAKALETGLERSRFKSEEEFTDAVTKVVDRLKTEFGDAVLDVKIDGRKASEASLSTGTPTLSGSRLHGVQLTIGKKTGSAGYAKPAQAKRAMEKMGFPEAEIITDETGQFFGVIQKDMPETSFYTSELTPQSDTFIGRHIKGARRVSDPFLADLGQVSGNARNKIVKGFAQPYMQKWGTLSGHERDVHKQLLMAGNNHSRWWSEDEANILTNRAWGRDLKPHELEALQAYKDLNDLEFIVRNEDRYLSLARGGYESASFESPLTGKLDNVNAKITRDWSQRANERIYNASDNIHYTEALTPQKIEDLKRQGYILIRSDEALDLKDKTRVMSFLVRGKDLNIKPVSKDQIPYRAGGHRMYADKWLVKQTRKRVQPDTQKEFLDSPLVHITGTKKEVEAWAAKMERARSVYNNKGGEAGLYELDHILDGEGESFVKGIEDGSIDKDHAFTPLYDRDMPSEYKESSLMSMFNDNESGADQWLKTTGRMYYGKKGETLKNWKGEEAPTLDPYQTINNALMNIANITAFSDYKASAVERWVKTFGPHTNMSHLDSSDAPGMLKVFREGVFKPMTDDRLLQAAEGQRSVIKRTIGWKTEGDLQMEQMTRRIGEFVFQGEAGSGLAAAERKLTDWWGNKNAVQSLRGMAFDMKLGLFNPSQLPMQASTMFATLALSPVHGFHSMITLVPLRHYLTKAGSEASLDVLVKRGVHTASGFSTPGEFKEFMRSAKSSGFFDFNVGHGLTNDAGPNAMLSTTGNAVENFRQAGRFFFHEPETWNRAVAWHVAWKETRQRHPGISTKSPEFLTRLQGRADDYSMSMSKTSEAWWQKGVLSVPTQFWAYNARMFEAMVGNTFTLPQRLRLVASQLLLYGSGGVPFVSLVTEKLRQNRLTEDDGKDDLDTFWGVADRGLLDKMVEGMTGADIVVGGKYGSGTWMSNLLKDLAGMGEYGPRSFADIAGGATFSILGQSGKAFYDVMHYMAAESGGDTGRPMTMEALKGLAANISTASNLMKANAVFQYGTWITNSGTVMAAGLPDANGFAALLGFQPGASLEISAMMSFGKDRTKRIEEAAKIISNYKTRMLTEPDHVEELADQINIFTKTLPADIRREAIKKSNMSVDISMYDSMLDRTRKIKAKMAEPE